MLKNCQISNFSKKIQLAKIYSDNYHEATSHCSGAILEHFLNTLDIIGLFLSILKTITIFGQNTTKYDYA